MTWGSKLSIPIDLPSPSLAQSLPCALLHRMLLVFLVIKTSLQSSQGSAALGDDERCLIAPAQGGGDVAAGAPAHSPAWAVSRTEPACVWGVRHPPLLNLHLFSPICQQPQHSKAAGTSWAFLGSLTARAWGGGTQTAAPGKGPLIAELSAGLCSGAGCCETHMAQLWQHI